MRSLIKFYFIEKISLISISMNSSKLFGQHLFHKSPDLSSEERAKDLTLEEKAALMCNVSEAIPRLGIKNFNCRSEALHGFANNNDVTVFPEPIGMAASFNDDLDRGIINDY